MLQIAGQFGEATKGFIPVRTSLIIFSLLAVLGAACSGTDDTTATADDTTTVTTPTATAADTSADAGTTDGDVSAIDATACSAAADALNTVPAAIAGAATGTGDMDAIVAQAQAFSDLADQVPAEVSDDFQVVGDAYNEIATTLSGIDIQSGEAPSAEAQAALQELSTTLGDVDFTTAASNISTYFANGCQ